MEYKNSYNVKQKNIKIAEIKSKIILEFYNVTKFTL